MIEFQRPEILLLLFIIPVVVFIHFISLIFFKKKAFKFANFETLKRLNDDKPVFSKKLIQLFIRIIYLVLIVFAAAGTSFWVDVEGVTDEVIFALDASGSMFAEDMDPNRLDASKDALTSFVSNTSLALRAGVISFTSVPYLELEPTDDKRVIENAINDVTIKKSRGTSIGEAINYAGAVFKDIDKEAAIIIITDGQENVLSIDELMDVVRDANSRNIKVHIIGVGTEGGASFEEGAQGVSVVNEETLIRISEINGGKWLTAKNKGEVLQGLYSFMETGTIKKEYDLTIALFMTGFVLLILEWYAANYFLRSFP